MSSTRPPDTETVARALHSAAIHLLRRLRKTDDQSGLSPARLSILSVLVFTGEKTPGELARIENVKPPTMTGLLQGLEQAGMVERDVDQPDKRISYIRITPRGRRTLARAQKLRLAVLQSSLEKLGSTEIRLLADAAHLMENMAADE